MLEKIHNQLPNDNHRVTKKKQLPITTVDKLADELVEEYHNPAYKRWYWGVIYDFGPDKVYEWQRRASDGDEPAKLFSKYVADYRGFNNDNIGDACVE